jgi:hypothetical protein
VPPSSYVCQRTVLAIHAGNVTSMRDLLLRLCLKSTASAAILSLALVAAPAAAGLFSATGQVFAILGDQLFVGEAEGHLNGAGTLAIHSQRDPGLSCTGDFVSSAAGGSGQLTCNDGSRATFSFARLTVFRGHGSGSYSRGPMSFSYGMPAAEAKRYLTLPAGKNLVRVAMALQLVDQ